MKIDLTSLLPLFIAVPILFSAFLIVFPKAKITGRALIVISPCFSIIFSTALLIHHQNEAVIAEQIGGWPKGISIAFVSDTFTALMILTTSVLVLVCALFAIASKDSEERYFEPLFLILSAGVAGALLTADLFNLFVFLELMFLPSCGLIVMRKGLKKLESSRLYVTINLLTSAVLISGVGLIYASAGTVNLAELAGSALGSDLVAGGFGVVLIALSIKAAIFPTHGWLTRTYPSTSPVITVLFSGLHTKVAIFAIFRIYAVAFEGSKTYLWFFAIIFCITMFVGAFGAFGETNLRSIYAFHMVSQIGYILMGVALFSVAGIMAGIFYLVHHSIIKASLFLNAGAIEETYGTGKLSKLSGLAKENKIAATSFFFAAMSITGLPPFSGFIAKFVLLDASISENKLIISFSIVAVSVITLMSMLKIWSSVYWENTQYRNETHSKIMTEKKIKLPLIAPGLILAILSLMIGIMPNLLLDLSKKASETLINIEPYVTAVLG